jgi:hypothetical protein
MACSSLTTFSWISSLSLIRRTAWACAQFSGCSSTTNAHSEMGKMAVCCQNLLLDVLSSHSTLSMLVVVLFKKFGLFLDTPCSVLCFTGCRLVLSLTGLVTVLRACQEWTNFPKIQEPPQNSRQKKGAMKQVAYWIPANVRHHYRKVDTWVTWSPGFVHPWYMLLQLIKTLTQQIVFWVPFLYINFNGGLNGAVP